MNHYGERGESHDSPSFSFLSPLDDDTDEEQCVENTSLTSPSRDTCCSDDSSSRIPPPIMLQSASSPPSLTASSSTSSPSSFLPPPSSIYVRRCDSSYSSIRGQNKSSDSRSTTFRIEKPTLFRTVKPTSDRINHISNERTRFWPGFRGETSRDPEQRIERVQKLRLPHSEDSEERFQVNESANFRNIAVNPVDEPIYSCPCGHDLSPDDLEEIAVSRLLGQKRKRDDSQEKDEDSHHEVSNEYPPPKRLRVETWGSWIAGLFELV